jgi:tetratricopeptide (TPR) repeat protein
MTHPDSATLYLAAAGKLPPDADAEMRLHIDECAVCAETARELEAFKQGLDDVEAVDMTDEDEAALTGVEPNTVPFRYAGDSLDEARMYAERLLATPANERETLVAGDEGFLTVETLCAAAEIVFKKIDNDPQRALGDALQLYKIAKTAPRRPGVFDDRNYALGEAALTVGKAYRTLDQTHLAERWLNLSEDAFQQTLNPTPELARVGLERAVAHVYRQRFQEALSIHREIQTVFIRYEMTSSYSLSRFREGYCLRMLGKIEPALQAYEQALSFFENSGDRNMAATVMQNMGDLYAEAGDLSRALPLMRKAVSIFQHEGNRVSLLQAKWCVADAVRLSGNPSDAVALFAELIQDYSDAEMPNWAAGLRLVQAENLLELGRHSEAEWEIRQALPYLDRPDAGPEAMAAILLLKRAVEARKIDKDSLRRAREALDTS